MIDAMKSTFPSRLKIGVVGHFTYFSNHFPENWESDENVYCLDVSESDYSFLINLHNFRPDVTIFYRPELYPRHYIDMVSGKKIAFLSEPIPGIQNGQMVSSSETDLRLAVYKGMNWSSFDSCVFYDSSKADTIKILQWPITSFSVIPINTAVFNYGNLERDIDVCFIGKPTIHRMQQLDFLRNSRWRFVWVAHGVSGRSLAELFQRSRVVLNIHADGLPAQEPRISLAASCGAIVLTESVQSLPTELKPRVIEYLPSLSGHHIVEALALYERTKGNDTFAGILGVRDFIMDQLVSCPANIFT